MRKLDNLSLIAIWDYLIEGKFLALEGTLCTIDVVLLVYFVYLKQCLIPPLFAIIVMVNIWRIMDDYLEYIFPLIREFDIVIFHTTFQLLPISISLAYYDTNDRMIDFIFIYIFICFMYKLYKEGNKSSYKIDNNTKMMKIMVLCVILDYIHVIMLIQSNL